MFRALDTSTRGKLLMTSKQSLHAPGKSELSRSLCRQAWCRARTPPPARHPTRLASSLKKRPLRTYCAFGTANHARMGTLTSSSRGANTASWGQEPDTRSYGAQKAARSLPECSCSGQDVS